MYSKFGSKVRRRGSKPEVESTTNDKLYKDILIMAWGTIAVAVGSAAITYMQKKKGGEGEQPQQQGMVAPPDPSRIYKKTEVVPFSFDPPTPTAGRHRIVGAQQALEAVNPSEIESRYWSAIFSDAKAKSAMSFKGFEKE
jgi:hypothetical protein